MVHNRPVHREHRLHQRHRVAARTSLAGCSVSSSSRCRLARSGAVRPPPSDVGIAWKSLLSSSKSRQPPGTGHRCAQRARRLPFGQRRSGKVCAASCRNQSISARLSPLSRNSTSGSDEDVEWSVRKPKAHEDARQGSHRFAVLRCPTQPTRPGLTETSTACSSSACRETGSPFRSRYPTCGNT